MMNGKPTMITGNIPDISAGGKHIVRSGQLDRYGAILERKIMNN